MQKKPRTRRCVVKNCLHDQDVTYHRLPKNIDTRNIWLDLLDLPTTVNGRVCSKHFHPSDFDRKGDGHIWLKPNAHPYQVDEFQKDTAVPNEVETEDLSVRNPLTSAERKQRYLAKLKANGEYETYKRKNAAVARVRHAEMKKSVERLPKALQDKITQQNHQIDHKKLAENRPRKVANSIEGASTSNTGYISAGALYNDLSKLKCALPSSHVKKMEVVSQLLQTFSAEERAEIVEGKKTASTGVSLGVVEMVRTVDLPTQCRMCLTESTDDKLESMLATSNDLITLWTMYIYIMSAGEEKFDLANVPFICAVCKENLQSAYRFKVMCTETEKTLSELVTTSYRTTDEPKTEYVVYDSEDNVMQYAEDGFEDNICENNESDRDAFEDIGGDVAGDGDAFVCKEEVCGGVSTEGIVESSGDALHNTNDDFTDESNAVNETVQAIDRDPMSEKVFNRKCKRCNIKFESITEYRVHYRQTHQRTYNRKLHKSNARKCPACDIQFENVKLYQVHYRKYHKRPVEPADQDAQPNGIRPKVLCPHCGQLFSKSFIGKHLESKHSGDAKKEHKCTTCGKVFSLIENLIMHKRIHSNDKRYECDICGEKFLFWSSRRNHIRSKHTGEMNYECHICNQKFVHSSTMYRHVQRHRNELPHSCDSCSKRFLTTVELKNHQIVHTKVKNEICDKCFKHFGTRKNLLAHMKIHSEPKYVCTVCDKRFTQYPGLSSHMKTHPDAEFPERGARLSHQAESPIENEETLVEAEN